MMLHSKIQATASPGWCLSHFSTGFFQALTAQYRQLASTAG
jgi:hypothetical protein